jgi:hypothetical protein
VIEFLTKIDLQQYTDSFKDEDIGGDTLLTLESDDLEDLQVTNSIHQLKIIHLFRKELLGVHIKYSNEHLCNFLKEQSMDKHVSVLKDNSVDGDLILEVDFDVMTKALNDVGITKLQAKKIITKYNTFVK